MNRLDVLFDPTKVPSRKVVVLYGMGGIGKTQLAAQFARRHQHRFTAMFWVDGSSQATLRQDLARYVERLPGHNSPKALGVSVKEEVINVEDLVQRFRAWLALPQNTDWLLMIDNVDKDFSSLNGDPQAYDVTKYFPSSDHGNILVTSRLVNLKHLGPCIHVESVDEHLAKEMLECSGGEGRNIIPGECQAFRYTKYRSDCRPDFYRYKPPHSRVGRPPSCACTSRSLPSRTPDAGLQVPREIP